ncbi:MAG: type IV pilus assembly protein PilY1, partial [Paraglaciecola sp.]
MSIQKLRISVAALVLSSMISATAIGDDLEIYLGIAGSEVTYDPNVIFIMDTSGSMSGKDGGEESRMLRVQNALKQTLESVTNINAGLMRFSDYGGPVLFPVRPIDDPVVPEIIVSVAQSSDDAYEIASVVNLSSNKIKLSQGMDVVYAGLRYRDLDIPQGATITNAYLRFTSVQSNVAPTTLTFSAELGPDAPTFSALSNNISQRSSTAATVVWSTDNDWPVGGETVTSADLSTVLQEVVNQDSWCGGQAMNLLIEGVSAGVTSARQAKAFEDGTSASPQLVVLYDETTATGCIRGNLSYQVNSQKNNAEEKITGYASTGAELTFNPFSNAYIGMRFRNIALPKDATVTNAYLVFTAYQNRTGSGASFDISGSDEKDAKSFKNHTRHLLRDKPKTAPVSWTNIPPWYKNNTYQSPPVTTIVQHLVNRADWELGNDMMLVISNMSGNRGAYAYKGKPSGAPSLVIEYSGNATPGASSTVRNHLINKVDGLSASGFTPI